jgi:HlyD family secretion protein
MKKILVGVVVLIGLVAGGAAYFKSYLGSETSMSYKTVDVVRGDLIDTIAATGTVEPEELVDVGAQVAGRIKEFGPDPSDPEGKKRIDFCSMVHEGTILARIDDSVYKAQLEQAKATYERAKADVLQLKAKLLQTERDRKRAEELKSIKDIPGTDRPIKGIADSEYDLAVANHEMAKANVAVGEATVKQTAAALDLANTNLSYTIIKSPVEGMIIARRVNIGQTVVASLNAPSTFLIAKDLRRMQVWAAVNEADIGRILSKKEMPVQFTVDAYPDEDFYGKVAQIRMNANTTQNVVMYQVVVTFDNSDLRLIPYLTASLHFEVEKHKDVLKVPNTALRWKPQKPEQIVPQLRSEVASTLENKPDEGNKEGNKQAAPTASIAKGKQESASKKTEEFGRIWVEDGKYVRPIEVAIGATDGTMTEITSEELKEDMKAVVGISRGEDVAKAEDTTNPFGPPKFFRGSKRPR